MNRDEWNVFKDKLFTSFPSFLAHINGKSPNPKGTLETWFETLADVSLFEANAVIKEWTTGIKDPPKAFEFDYIAIVIKARVDGMRFQETRYRTARNLFDEKQQVKQRRESYEPIVPDLVEAFEIASAAWRRKLDGEITHQEYNEICRKACMPDSTSDTHDMKPLAPSLQLFRPIPKEVA